MRAALVGDESYDTPPRLGSGVLVGLKGVVHVVRENRGIRILLYCHDYSDAWQQYNSLTRGWFEHPTCVHCAIHPGAIRARFEELQWRVEWWEREGNKLATPFEVEPRL